MPPVSILVDQVATNEPFVEWWDDSDIRAAYLVEYKKECRRRGHVFFHDCLREGYARFIEWGFRNCAPDDTWFWTGTFRFDVSQGRADACWRDYIRRLEDAVNQRTKGTVRLRYVLATEMQVRGTVHFHAIIHVKGLSQLSRRRWEERWNWMAGFCRCGAYCSAGAPYLAKYVSKGTDIQVGGDWSGRTAPRRLDCAFDHALARSGR